MHNANDKLHRATGKYQAGLETWLNAKKAVALASSQQNAAEEAERQARTVSSSR